VNDNGKILLTGADGFIGSHVAELLVRSHRRVKAFVFYNSFSSWGWLDSLPKEILEQIEVYPGDIRDSYCVRNAMRDCDVVMHLAALIAIPFSYEAPENYVDTNIKGTLNVLQAARDFGVRKIVQTSTSEVYGTARFVPITEEHPLQPQSPYSASKIGADQIAASFHSSFGTPVAIIRPFNTYGPRQSARAVIPTIITQLATGQRRIHLGATHPTRDFSYVADTARGFLAVADSPASEGQVINLGSNFEISIGETAKLIAELMGVEIEIETDEARLRPENSEVCRLWADNTKAQKLVGWSPMYAGRDGLRNGLQETIEWFIRPENRKLYKSSMYNI
jgi:dTDP-glucose 4,6-dehydratase